MQRKHVTKEEIDQFLNGNNPMERIIKLEIDYNDDKVHIFYRDEKGVKKCQIEPFYPFVWAKQSAARCLFNGDRKKIKDTLNEYGIACKGLIIDDLNGNIHPRMENGYRVLFYAKIPMSFSKFMQFFIDGGRPIYPKQGDLNYNLRDYIVVAPNEQHMISTGKRLFKGYNDYDDLIRMQWDLETEGLTPETDMISQIGIRTNKGFEKIICIDGQTREEKGEKELEGMAEFFQTIKDIDPDVITGYNTENFDWNFEDVRLKKHNSSLSEFTAPYFNGKGIYKKKKQSVLKLGGEMEYYYPTVKYGTNLTDGLFSVRRAQAIDSNMKKADLKYITKYSKLNKPNRVYVPGKIINSTWVEIDTPYAFNNANGHWFKITDKLLEKTYEIEKSKEEQDLDNFLNFNDDNTPQKIKSKLYTFNGNTLVNNQTGETFEVKNGRYIVERYLADDLWETDKVELRYNQPNFLVGKMLPVSFEKMCTMGTAAIWKYIMLAWSYEHDLAIPELIETRKFVGGLSRLLSVGYVDRIVKLDYNSLYPSIILSYDIKSPIDISGVMSALLEYILTQREYYKGLKGEYGKKAKKIKKKIESNPNIENKEALIKEQLQYEAESARNDKMQLPLKITGNGFFGSYGSGSVFPHSDIECAEMTTCIGRMCLRLMISHFNKLGYKPIVGDSVTYDTPIMVKTVDDTINILPICDIFNENTAILFENEQYRDFSNKNYKVLTRNGWQDIKYVYKHKTNKTLHRIETKNGLIDCTEDHSLFDDNLNEIKPSELKQGSKIEIYNNEINYTIDNTINKEQAWLYGFFMADGSSVYCDRTQKYFSKRKNKFVLHRGKRANWKISNKTIDRLIKAQEILSQYFCIKSSIKNNLKSSNVYNLVVENTEFAKHFSKIFYTSYRYKKVPEIILNSSKEVKKSFLDGFCCGDGQGDTMEDCIEFGQKSKVAMAGLYFILKELKYNFRCHNRSDKSEFISFRFKNHRGNNIDDTYSKREENEVWNNTIVNSKSDYVYDISADGTFINALGMICLHNTDGFNFQMPNNEDIRYTEEHPYISNGKGRNSENGKAYTGVDADVAEFEDMFLCYPYTVETGNKMGLGVDEYCDATINFARKNYADLLDIKSDKIKLVGNTIKSKKMPIYIEKFLDKGIKLLLHGKGKEFLEFYYDYVEKIYNMQIPLKDIATVGKIKTSIDTYINSCKQLTAGGTKKARQAWYELAIKHSLNVHMGDAIYYINTGNKKSSSDVQRITKFYYINDNGQKVNYVTNEDGTPMTDRKGNNIDLTKQIEREYNKVKKNAPDSDFIVNGKTRKYKISLFEFGKKKYPNLQEEDVLIFNCVMLSNDIVEDEEDHFCSEDFEYNKDKYIDMFNKRIKPLLVCFDKSIRTTIDAKGKEKSNILITDPSDRRVFTEEESKLVSGQPYNATDQDTYQQLMTIEDKEIKFWLSVNKKPPYADECDINWEETVSDYNERMKRYQEEGIKAEIEEYEKIVNNFSQDDIENLIEEGILPDKLLKFAELDVKTNSFVSKKFNIKIGSLSDVFDILGESEWDEVAE